MSDLGSCPSAAGVTVTGAACKACVCARSGKPCTDCTPSHVGRYENRGGAGGAKPDDRGQNRVIINDDTPVNGQMKSHGQSTERERLESSNDGEHGIRHASEYR